MSIKFIKVQRISLFSLVITLNEFTSQIRMRWPSHEIQLISQIDAKI